MINKIDKLIVVPGHAPFKDSVEELPDDFQKDGYWVLQEFQKGEPRYYVEHIQAAAELAAQNPASLLVFSGGRTRREAQKWSEAATYKAVYDKLNQGVPSQNIALEEFARDSLQNLQFGLYRFYRKVGRYPLHVTVVGWKFKDERFHLHADTLDIDSSAFTYAGVNDPEDLTGAMKGESKAMAEFRADPFGNGNVLGAKREERNPFGEMSPYDTLPRIRI